MVTDQYSHILDESRVLNAHLLEEAFYGRRGSEASMVTHPASEKKADPVVQQLEASGMDAAALVQILSNPEMVNMLKMLSKTLVGTRNDQTLICSSLTTSITIKGTARESK